MDNHDYVGGSFWVAGCSMVYGLFLNQFRLAYIDMWVWSAQIKRACQRG